MASGEVELMLHRRLLYDDAFGVGEPLDEVAFGQGLVVRGTEWLQGGKFNKRYLGLKITGGLTYGSSS